MDAILRLLQKIYSYVYNQPLYEQGQPITQIYATQSKSDIGLPVNTLKEIIVNVFGNNTCTALYGDERILDTMTVPDAKNIIEGFLNEKINEEFISFEKNKPKNLGDSPEPITPIEGEYKIISQQLKFGAGSRQKIPHRVKMISPIKQISPVKPIKPVRKINPWRSIPRPKSEDINLTDFSEKSLHSLK